VGEVRHPKPPNPEPLRLQDVARILGKSCAHHALVVAQRQRQAAWLHHHYVTKESGPEVIVDLHPNIDFGSQSYTTQCHSLVGSSRPFAVRRARDVCGFSLSLNAQLDGGPSLRGFVQVLQCNFWLCLVVRRNSQDFRSQLAVLSAVCKLGFSGHQ
jgi:hypothetical protein